VQQSFRVSFLNKTSDKLTVQDPSVLMGAWVQGEAPPEGHVIYPQRAGGPWQTESDDTNVGTGGLVCLQGEKSEIIANWLLFPDGKRELQLIENEYEIESESVEEIYDSDNLLWKIVIIDKKT